MAAHPAPLPTPRGGGGEGERRRKTCSRVRLMDAKFVLTNTGSTGTLPSSTQLLDRAMRKGGETLGKDIPQGHNQTPLKEVN